MKFRSPVILIFIYLHYLHIYKSTLSMLYIGMYQYKYKYLYKYKYIFIHITYTNLYTYKYYVRFFCFWVVKSGTQGDFKCLFYLFLSERESMGVRKVQNERQRRSRERIPSTLLAVSTEPDVGSMTLRSGPELKSRAGHLIDEPPRHPTKEILILSSENTYWGKYI